MALKPKPKPPTPVDRLDYEYHTQPFDHQDLELRLAAMMPERARHWEVGTGKTKVWLDEACFWWKHNQLDTLIVFTKNRVHRQWVEEQVVAHVPPWVKYRAAYWKAGLVNKAFHEAVVAPEGTLRILVFNIECLSRMTQGTFRAKKLTEFGQWIHSLYAGRKVGTVIDESHLVASPSSKRTHALWQLRDLSVYRRSGTGTEITTGYESLWAPFYFLNPKIIGCQTFTEFRYKYCVTRGQFNTIVGYRNIDELMEKIGPYVSVVEKSDCPDLMKKLLPALPPVIYPFEMSTEQTRVYNDLVELYAAELASGEIVEAELAITRLQKLQQVASGHIQVEGHEWRPIPTTRFEETLQIVKQIRGKAIVWAEWHPDIIQLEAAMEEAGIKSVPYYGGISSSRADKNLELFKTDKSIKILNATTGKGGTGLDLFQATDAIYFNLGFNFVNYVQSKGRIHRPGQTEQVMYHVLRALRSVDTKLIRSHNTRQDLTKVMRDPEVFKSWLSYREDEEDVRLSHEDIAA